MRREKTPSKANENVKRRVPFAELIKKIRYTGIMNAGLLSREMDGERGGEEGEGFRMRARVFRGDARNILFCGFCNGQKERWEGGLGARRKVIRWRLIIRRF